MPANLAFHILAAVAASAPAEVNPDLAAGFAGALRGCEEWVLKPASWADGVGPFKSAVGLGDRMGLVKDVAPASLPPPPLRRANHYWRINATSGAGYVLVVSDQLPMCHITGGGDADLQPVVESVLAASAFTGRWDKLSETTAGDMTSSVFRNREEPAMTITISRAKKPGARRDRVQVIATAVFKTSN